MPVSNYNVQQQSVTYTNNHLISEQIHKIQQQLKEITKKIQMQKQSLAQAKTSAREIEQKIADLDLNKKQLTAKNNNLSLLEKRNKYQKERSLSLLPLLLPLSAVVIPIATALGIVNPILFIFFIMLPAILLAVTLITGVLAFVYKTKERQNSIALAENTKEIEKNTLDKAKLDADLNHINNASIPSCRNELEQSKKQQEQHLKSLKEASAAAKACLENTKQTESCPVPCLEVKMDAATNDLPKTKPSSPTNKDSSPVIHDAVNTDSVEKSNFTDLPPIPQEKPLERERIQTPFNTAFDLYSFFHNPNSGYALLLQQDRYHGVSNNFHEL